MLCGNKFLVAATVVIFAAIAMLLAGNNWSDAEKTGWALRGAGAGFATLGFIFVLEKVREFFAALEDGSGDEEEKDDV